MSERSLDVNKASSSISQSKFTSNQQFRIKNSVSNLIKEKSTCPPPRISPKHKAIHKQRQSGEVPPNNNSVNDLSAQFQNLTSDHVNFEQTNTVKPTKRKNARRKQRIKQMLLGAPETEAQSSSSMSESSQQAANNANIGHQIGQLHVANNSRYLENLAYHPNFQYAQRAQVNVVPSIPIVQNMALMQEPSSPQYFQNIMQHPLLYRIVAQPGADPRMFYQHTIPQNHATPLQNNAVAPQNYVTPSQNYSTLPQNYITPPQNYTNPPQNYAASLLNYANPSLNYPTLNYATPLQGHTIPQLQQLGKKLTSKQLKKDNKQEKSSEGKKFEPYLSVEEVEEGLKDNTLIEGVLRINPKQYQHSYVASTDRNEQDVLINGIQHRNRGLEGDVVVVQILPDIMSEPSEDKQQKRGKIVYIKEKLHTRTCIGCLKLMPDKNRKMALFVPRDYRVPRLNIPCTNWPADFYKNSQNYENTLFLAKILEWADTRFAVGTIECHIGRSGDMITETKAILAQNDLDISPFGAEMRDLYPRLDYKIPEEEIKLREDCRKLCLFSIDPFNCRDIDDAVSCRLLDNGNYEIGVHISDVAHFLTENTKLDEKVADKATTIYLVERAYHMLPDDLCLLCSLFPGVDKLAFSVFWEITGEGKIVSHRFTKTVIQSCCQLAYDHAQAILEDSNNAIEDFPEIYNGFKYEDIYKSIKILGQISSIFRKNRFEGGALRIDQPKLSFQLDASGLPETFNIYQNKESHQLIEEFMLLANMTVAKRIYDDHPKLAFLRCHPPPSVFMLRQLAKSLSPLGIDLDIASAGTIHNSLLPHVNPDGPDKGKAMVLSMLCAKPMTRAKYFCAGGHPEDQGFEHYALNVPLYTHFTSPIRRYADIMVHRLLAASLNYRETPNWEVDHVRMIAAQCNKQKYNAKKAGEMSTEFYALKYIEMHSPVVTEAVVVDVREKYIDVIVIAMGLNRRIYFNNDFPGVYKCVKNDAGTRLSKMQITWHGKDSNVEVDQTIEVFAVINVEMHKGDDLVKVETKLIRPQ